MLLLDDDVEDFVLYHHRLDVGAVPHALQGTQHHGHLTAEKPALVTLLHLCVSSVNSSSRFCRPHPQESSVWR